MVQSAFTAPHVSEWLTCDVTATVELLDRLRARREFAEIKISALLIIARAVCLALRRTPQLNSSWDEAAQEIVIKSAINLGIAAATPRGLVVPNIPDAGRLSLVDLATMINQVVATAREGRTQPADMSGGTLHDHQHRGVRGRRRHADPQSRARPGSSASVRSPAVPGWSAPAVRSGSSRAG